MVQLCVILWLVQPCINQSDKMNSIYELLIFCVRLRMPSGYLSVTKLASSQEVSYSNHDLGLDVHSVPNFILNKYLTLLWHGSRYFYCYFFVLKFYQFVVSPEHNQIFEKDITIRRWWNLLDGGKFFPPCFGEMLKQSKS